MRELPRTTLRTTRTPYHPYHPYHRTTVPPYQTAGWRSAHAWGVKHIGKPCTGELYARFDEGGLASCDYDSAREAPPNESGGNR